MMLQIQHSVRFRHEVAGLAQRQRVANTKGVYKRRAEEGRRLVAHPSIVVPVPMMEAPAARASPGTLASMVISPLRPSFPPKSCRVVQMNGAPKKE